MATERTVPVKIEIIWDRDHGTENEGWFVRRTFADGREEDDHLGDPGYDLSDEDDEVCCALLDESDFGCDQIEVRR